MVDRTPDFKSTEHFGQMCWQSRLVTWGVQFSDLLLEGHRGLSPVPKQCGRSVVGGPTTAVPGDPNSKDPEKSLIFSSSVLYLNSSLRCSSSLRSNSSLGTSIQFQFHIEFQSDIEFEADPNWTLGRFTGGRCEQSSEHAWPLLLNMFVKKCCPNLSARGRANMDTSISHIINISRRY